MSAKQVTIGKFGALHRKQGGWESAEVQTDLGEVFVCADEFPEGPEQMAKTVETVLNDLPRLDREAREYLKSHPVVPGAKAPVLGDCALHVHAASGRFSVFYSSSEESDETLYGVEFSQGKPASAFVG